MGKYYSINFPLKDGMDDASYQAIFKPVVAKIMQIGPARRHCPVVWRRLADGRSVGLLQSIYQRSC